MNDMWREHVMAMNREWATDALMDLSDFVFEALALFESGHPDLARELLAIGVGIPLRPGVQLEMHWEFAEKGAKRLSDDMDEFVSRYRMRELLENRSNIPWAKPGDGQWQEAEEMAHEDADWYRAYLVALVEYFV
jgi:hypothetical protein